MTDQEREVELLQNLSWDNRWISRFGCGIVGEWSDIFAIGVAIGIAISVAIGVAIADPSGMAIEMSVGRAVGAVDFTIGNFCANTLLDSLSAE